MMARFVALILILTTVVQARDEILVFEDVTILDGTGAPPRPGMNVLVGGDKIISIGKRAPIPPQARAINCTGKYMIPGLWDMHVHWMMADYLPLFVANGVTGARQMFGMPMMLGWRKNIEEGKLLGPRLYLASPIVDGPKPVWPGSIPVDSREKGRKAARELSVGGADFIKVYSLLPRDAYFALADEANKIGFPFAGHVPLSVRFSEVIEAGQKSIEHMRSIISATSDLEDEYFEAMTKALDGGNPFEVRRTMTPQLIENHNPEKARALYIRMARKRTWMCPTLVVMRNMAWLDENPFAADPNLKYIPEFVKGNWDPKTDFRLKNRTPEDWAQAKKNYKHMVKLVGDMYRRSVPIMAGTDVLNPYCLPGFSLHDELALLVEAGMHPLAAIRAATADPARFMGVYDKLGSVEAGKLADLVILDANPMNDIANTRTINAVMTNGVYYNRAALDEMLAKAERKANPKK